jgi:hypothetical protein
MLRQQVFLATDAELTINLVQLHEELHLRPDVVDRQYGAIHGDAAAIRQHDIGFALDEGLTGLHRLPQTTLQDVPRADEEIGSFEAQDMAGADRQQHFTGRVDIDEAQPLVEKQDSGIKVVKDVFF